MAKKSKKNNYVSLNAASKILNVSPETMRNWDKQGKLKAIRNPMNNYRLYDLEELKSLSQVNFVSEPSFDYPELFDNSSSFKSAVKNMSKCFRDSEGGSLLDRFEEISKLLFCKIYDEEFNNGKVFSEMERTKPDSKIYKLIVDLFDSAIAKYPNVFVNGRAQLSNDIKAISQVCLILKSYELKSINSDVKGKIYEELIKNTLDKNENQQFFTPRHIVDLLIEIVNPRPDMSFCDPACGSGGFLISAIQYLKQKYPDLDLEEYSKDFLRGIEIDSRMVWIAQMNLILHGGHNDSIKYLSGSGSLGSNVLVNKNLQDNSFDIIVTNPPFGSDFDVTSDLNKFELGKGKKSRRRGVLFVEKCLKLLKDGGRLAIILEESILNNSSNEDVRRYIMLNSAIEAVISLPESTFMPYATVKTSIVVLRKKSKVSDLREETLMCNIENVGYGPNGDPIFSNDRNENGKLKLLSDIPETLQKYREFIRTGTLESATEKFFTTKLEEKTAGQRLDVLFHHPSKLIAQELLMNSKYPLYKIAELVTIMNKMVVPQSEFPDETVRYIGLANISSFDGTFYVSDILGEKIKSAVRFFEPNTVVFSKMRPELRKVIYIPSSEDAGYVSSECYVFKASNKILPEYLSLILRSDLVYGQIIFQVTGIGRPRIGKEELLSVKIPVPPISKQVAILSVFNAYEANRNILIEKSKTLQEEADRIIRKSYDEIATVLCH